MSQTLLTLATIVTLAGHSLFGCCWHHGHAHGPGGRPGRQAERGETSERVAHRHPHRHGGGQGHHSGPVHHSHPGGPHDAPAPDAPVPDDPGCHDGHCVFVRSPDAGSLMADELAGLWGMVVEAVPAATVGVPLGTAAPSGSDEEPPDFGALHARRGVWLI